MGISVSTSSGGASRPRALASRRLMDVDERLPTKYPTLYVAMGASVTGSSGSCRCPMPARQNPTWGDSLYALGHVPTRRDHEAIGQLTMKKNWCADSLLLKKRDLLLRLELGRLTPIAFNLIGHRLSGRIPITTRVV